MPDQKSLQTLLSHSDYTAPEGFSALSTSIHHASTVVFKNVAAMRSRSWQNKSSYTYGLHGTPEPGNVGHTESHGCVRLTNWDAARVAALVKPGTPVLFR